MKLLSNVRTILCTTGETDQLTGCKYIQEVLYKKLIIVNGPKVANNWVMDVDGGFSVTCTRTPCRTNGHTMFSVHLKS